MLRPIFLACMATAAIALALMAGGSGASVTPGFARTQRVANAVPARGHAIRVACNRPATLRLIRFEDGSARLECGRSVLVRVSVPG